MQPGNYHLSESIKITKADTVLLGLGMATLIATNGNSCIQVADVDGVRVAGVLLEAGEDKSKSDNLLEWGLNVGKYPGNHLNPGVMSDVFARVGGRTSQFTNQVFANSMVVINSGYVVIDNTWLWRADHDISGSVFNGNNPCDNGIVVNGDYVTAYALAAEHTLGDLVQWNGNHGTTIFYQSEYPYDVTADYANRNFVSYRVSSEVTDHKAYGVGVYSFFRDNEVNMDSAISAPDTTGVTFTNSLSVFLNGKGSIKHVINDQGETVHAGQ